jgi:hypothetical protein
MLITWRYFSLEVRPSLTYRSITTRLDKELMVVPFPEGFGASVHFAWPGKDYIPLGVYVHPYLLVIDRLSGFHENQAEAGSESWIKDAEGGQSEENKADNSLTNQKPSAIYRLRPHFPQDAPLPTSTATQAANLGIEIAPLTQLEQLLSTIGGGANEGKGKEVAGKVDVGKVAEKVVKNVRLSIPFLLFLCISTFGQLCAV